MVPLMVRAGPDLQWENLAGRHVSLQLTTGPLPSPVPSHLSPMTDNNANAALPLLAAPGADAGPGNGAGDATPNSSFAPTLAVTLRFHHVEIAVANPWSLAGAKAQFTLTLGGREQTWKVCSV